MPWGPLGSASYRASRNAFQYSEPRTCNTALLKDGTRPIAPGGRGTAIYSLGARQLSAAWTIRANAVWRRGRVFLTCDHCNRNSTRLYVPTRDSWLACRRCWGLTYTSRTLHNYKDSIWGAEPSQRPFKHRSGTGRSWRLMTRDWSGAGAHVSDGTSAAGC